jgi:hypothetical protein
VVGVGTTTGADWDESHRAGAGAASIATISKDIKISDCCLIIFAHFMLHFVVSSVLGAFAWRWVRKV